jgi:hypothetical protein
LADTAIAPDKLSAYRATCYQVGTGSEAFSLVVDIKSDALLRLYRTTGQSCGIFITGSNPFGQTQSDAVNEARHSDLKACLCALVPHVFEGVGADPNGLWPTEASFFALGIDMDAARQLGVRFRQDAVVWAGPDAIPKLLLLR